MGIRGPKPTVGDAKKRLGDLSIYKGSTPDGVAVVQWDSIPECDSDHCNIKELCPHTKSGKCGVQKEYLEYVYTHYIGSVNPKDKMALFKIGIELVPLYSHLITLKIANHGRRATYITDKGDLKINPLFREIRETIRCIGALLGSIAESFEEKANAGDGGVGDDLTGNSEYYDNLFKGEAPRVERKRRNRV